MKEICKTGAKPGFVIIDILPKYNITESQVKYFIEKVSSIYSKKNIRPFLPILIGLSFSSEAFSVLKEKGILATTVKNFLGEKTSELLNSLVEVIKDIKKIILNFDEENAKKISKIYKEIVKYEGKVNNIKGHLFEMLAANILFACTKGYIDLNKKIKFEKEAAEIDIYCSIEKTEILVVECKGQKSLIDKEQIEHWKEKISIIYKWIKANPSNNEKSVRFEFWTTSDFNDDAKGLLNSMKIIKKYSIDWKNKEDIKKICKENKLSGQLEIIEEYY